MTGRLRPLARSAALWAVLGTPVLATPATELLAAGDYARAYAAAQADAEPLTAARAALGAALYSGGERAPWLARAEAAGRGAVRASPQSAEAQLELGTALCLQAERGGLTLGAYRLSRQCRAAYEAALNLDPALHEARAALARWHSGAWARAGILGGGQPATARQLAQAALSAAPDDLSVVLQAARVALDLRDRARARELLTRVLALIPADATERNLQAEARELLSKLGP